MMHWYGVRNIYHFGVNSNGKNVFEERVVVIEASSFEEAHEKGLAEAEVYGSENGFESHNEQIVYQQDGVELFDGYEVWSELFEADMSLNLFYTERYEKFEYDPDNA